MLPAQVQPARSGRAPAPEILQRVDLDRRGEVGGRLERHGARRLEEPPERQRSVDDPPLHLVAERRAEEPREWGGPPPPPPPPPPPRNRLRPCWLRRTLPRPCSASSPAHPLCRAGSPLQRATEGSACSRPSKATPFVTSASQRHEPDERSHVQQTLGGATAHPTASRWLTPPRNGGSRHSGTPALTGRNIQQTPHTGRTTLAHSPACPYGPCAPLHDSGYRRWPGRLPC
jgi:hypothetical protein